MAASDSVALGRLNMYLELHGGIVETANQPGIAHGSSVLAAVHTTKAKFSRPVDRRIQVVVMLLENNSHQQILVEDVARLVNLSTGRLAHLFKSEMEVSIQQYLTQLRLARAKSQLESTFLSPKEIAASVGFSSVTRFVVCFKNLVGTTPAHYRKHFLNGSCRAAESLALARSAKT